MKRKRSRCWVAAICVAFAGAAPAQTPADLSVWFQREQIYRQTEGLAEADLKALFLLCSRDAAERMLGFEEGARCVIVLEVLKKRSFGGDFGALLAWWRSHRDDPVDDSSGGDAIRLEPAGRGSSAKMVRFKSAKHAPSKLTAGNLAPQRPVVGIGAPSPRARRRRT
jgi:hypothetical protein